LVKERTENRVFPGTFFDEHGTERARQGFEK
jgi:hypothetical protein